jgi:tetratricopeptide (TPR) repeat protein/DNA-binding winged helix-turn-helix (wHTH) protein
MKLLDRPGYLVGEVEIDLASNCLRRDGQEQRLRQKSFQVLLYLLEHHERLVTKEELIQTIWDGAAVTDDTLVQIIVELRKTLGDDARHPQFIRTIPKIGYQFIAPVSRIHPASANGTNATLVEIEEITTVQVEYEQVIDGETRGRGDAAMEQRGDRAIEGESDRAMERVGDGASGRFRRRLAVSPRRRAAVLTVCSFLLLALAAAWLVLGRTERHSTAAVTLPRVPGKKPVAVMYFENRANDRELDWLREGLADMLIASLSRSQRLTLLSRQQLTALLGHTGQQNAAPIKLEDGLEIARRAQAETMILGGFARLGDKVRIDVTLHDARTGQLQAAESLIADTPAQILTQIDLLSLKLATHLGATLAESDAQRGLAAMMTNNLDAYRYYSLALEQAQMFQFHESIALLEKALALDSQFAMAQARIGYVYAVRMGQGEKARPYLDRALALAGRLSEKDKLFITAWQASAVRDPARAIEVYHDLIARYPMETEAYQRLSWVLQTQNRNEEALTVIRQGLLTDPDWKDLHNALGSVCMRLGRNEEALAAYQRYIQLAPNDPNAWDSLGTFHQWLGQYAEAEAAYHRALALNPESSVAIIHLGNLRFQQGRYAAAAEQYRRFSQIARDDKARARGFNCQAWVYWKQGDLAQAAAAAKEEMKYDPQSVFPSLVLALQQRDSATVAKLSEVAFTPANQSFLSERGFLRIWEYQHGFVAMRQGRAAEAIPHFRAALQHRAVEWNIDSFEDCLANALLESGRNDEAIAEYERILKINPRYPLAHYHLGLAYERRGQPQQAHAAYAQFLELWRDADSDLPELIEAKRRLAALQ